MLLAAPSPLAIITGEVNSVFCETTALVKFKTLFGFSPFSILVLTSAVSPRHCCATGWQKAFEPPILLAKVAVSLWPGAFLLHSADV